jgi:phage FluMu protein Com
MIMRLTALMHKTYEDSTPDKTGTLKAYCTACNMMIMEGEEACPKCKHIGFTTVPPEGKDIMRTVPLTRGCNANPIQNGC